MCLPLGLLLCTNRRLSLEQQTCQRGKWKLSYPSAILPAPTCLSRSSGASPPPSRYMGQGSRMKCMGSSSCLASTASGLPSMPVTMAPPRSAAPAYLGPGRNQEETLTTYGGGTAKVLVWIVGIVSVLAQQDRGIAKATVAAGVLAVGMRLDAVGPQCRSHQACTGGSVVHMVRFLAKHQAA